MQMIQRGVCAALILLASLVATQPAMAQGNDAGIGVGALGLISRDSVHADNVDDLFNSRTGAGGGLWVGGNKNGLIGFTGEFIYLVKRVDQSGIEFKTQALEIPALLRVNIGSRSQNGLTVYAVGGPVFTWNLKQTLGGIEVGDDFRTGNIGVMGGVGFEVFRLGIEGRGNWGQRTISTDGDFAEAKTFAFELVGKIRFN